MMAASFTAGHDSEEATRTVRLELRGAAEVMHALAQQSEIVTTTTRPSREYVTATTSMHTRLTAIERESLSASNQINTARRINVDQALADLLKSRTRTSHKSQWT